MPKRALKRSGPAGPSTPVLPPAIRLVHAFGEAVERSRKDSEPSDEAFLIEGLLIAAEASFTALSDFADLWHDGTYGASTSVESGAEQTVLDGYGAWLDAAGPLRERLERLKETGYESERVERFEACSQAAQRVLDDARDRRSIEQEALRTDRLAELAHRVQPLTGVSYDDEGQSA